jgi:hypothetical protein
MSETNHQDNSADQGTTHEQIVAAFNSYIKENEAFVTKGVKAAGTRARKALGELGKLTKERRKEIQESKNSAE